MDIAEITIDIETIPDQSEGAINKYLEEADKDFRAPSTLTKGEAAKDMGFHPDEVKYDGKDKIIKLWEKRMKKEKLPEIAEQKWRKTALDGSKGSIYSVCVAFGDEDPIVDHGFDEGKILRYINSVMVDTLCHKSGNYIKDPFFIGHNISSFDLKFLYHRYVINKIKPMYLIGHNNRHKTTLFDNMIEWCGYNGRISQDNLCKALGIEGKPDDIDGSKVWDYIKAGKGDRVAEYNIDDVLKARQVYKRLNFKE